MELRLGARQSDLARLQAYQVGQALEHCYPDTKIKYEFRESLGDLNQNDPLWKMPEKGVFTQDFRQGLVDGCWDLVVHSWKDLPTEQEAGTQIVATLPRADRRDLFLFKKNHWDKVKDSKKLNVFSSSPRRIYNLGSFFLKHFPAPLLKVDFTDVRGNILTRIEKLIASDQVDGLIVAKAALDRLLTVEAKEFQQGQKRLKVLLAQCQWQVLPLSQNPTAAAQGALAVEIASQRDDLKQILQSVNCQETWATVQKERDLLKSYGGGCHQKIGVSVMRRSFGDIIFLKGETELGVILDDFSYNLPSFELEKPLKKQPQWFERSPCRYQIPSAVNAHLVSRSNAMPEDFKPTATDVVWTSGLKTWKDLAKRGIWVNGSFDALGEDEGVPVQALCSHLHWAKWSHTQAPFAETQVQASSYQLVPQVVQQDITSFKEFFWMSGSQFDEAIKQQPTLLQRKHFCGPGHTFTHIQKVLHKNGIVDSLTVLPSYRYWQYLVKEAE